MYFMYFIYFIRHKEIGDHVMIDYEPSEAGCRVQSPTMMSNGPMTSCISQWRHWWTAPSGYHTASVSNKQCHQWSWRL